MDTCQTRYKIQRFFSFSFSFISLIADGPHHYHPACGHKGSSHLSPVHALQFFYRNASSALLQLVNQWLNFTYSRSHAFRYERKNTNPTLVRIELTDFRTSRCAAYLLDHSGDDAVLWYSPSWVPNILEITTVGPQRTDLSGEGHADKK